jgi:hypothetical protein
MIDSIKNAPAHEFKIYLLSVAALFVLSAHIHMRHVIHRIEAITE